MAKRSQTILLCDICDSERDVRSVRIVSGDDRAKGDLCVIHRGPIDKVVRQLAPAPRGLDALPVLNEDERNNLARSLRTRSGRATAPSQTPEVATRGPKSLTPVQSPTEPIPGSQEAAT